MPDFNHLTPPKTITDPNANPAAGDEYPRHLYDKANQFVIVKNDEEKAARLAEGFALKPHPGKR